MPGADDDDFGALEGAHTAENSGVAPEPGRVAKVGATRATVEAAIGDLAGRMASPEAAEQPSLMLDEMDEQMALFAGPVKHVADTRLAARGRGRPKGSTNKNGFRDVALRMGYRHPGLNLLDLANADKHMLAVELSALPVPDGMTGTAILQAYMTSGLLKREQVLALIDDAVAIMMKANVELMPYFEGKAAQQLDVNIRTLGVMVIGDMKTERADDDGTLDLTRVAAPE